MIIYSICFCNAKIRERVVSEMVCFDILSFCVQGIQCISTITACLLTNNSISFFNAIFCRCTGSKL